jgi:hypothetical protein
VENFVRHTAYDAVCIIYKQIAKFSLLPQHHVTFFLWTLSSEKLRPFMAAFYAWGRLCWQASLELSRRRQQQEQRCKSGLIV